MELGISLGIVSIVGGSAGPPSPKLMNAIQSFAEDQNSTPWYGNACYPSFTYDVDRDVLWATWEGFDGNDRDARFRTWEGFADGNIVGGRIYILGKSTLANDSHGVPVVTVNPSDGRAWFFFGRHSNLGAQRVYVVTKSSDTFTITKLTDITGSGDIGYPHPVIVGSKLYLFLRKDEDDLEPTGVRFGAVMIGTISGASISWGSILKYGDLGDDTRWYLGKTSLVDERYIHLTAARANLADTSRRDTYYLILDTNDDKITNFDGSTSVTYATWSVTPIGRSSLDSNFRVVNIGSNFGSIPSAELAGGKAHIVYKSDPSAMAGSIYYVNATLGVNSWSTPVKITTGFATGSTDYMLGKGKAVDTLILIYRGTDNNLYQMLRTAGGVWQNPIMFAEHDTDEQLDSPTMIEGLPGAFGFANTDDDETVEGHFKNYLAINNGFTIISDGYRGTLSQLLYGLDRPAQAHIDAYSEFLDWQLSKGIWQKRKFFWLGHFDTGIHLRSWKVGQYDLVESGTGTGWQAGVLGWQGNGTNRLLTAAGFTSGTTIVTDTNLNQMLASIGGGPGTSGKTGRIGFGGTQNVLALPPTGSGGPVWQGFSTAALTGTENTKKVGVIHGNRSATAGTMQFDGVAAGSGTFTDSAQGTTVLQIGAAKTTGWTDAKMLCAAVGASLTAQQMTDDYTSIKLLINTIAPGTLA